MNESKDRKKARISGTTPRELWTGTNPELLQALHLVTREGQINADARRKLKQIYHLTQLIEPLLKCADEEAIHVLDVGAGKSYLGFMLYDLNLAKNKNAWVSSIEARSELVVQAHELAEKLAYQRMKFVEGRIGDQSTFDEIQKPVQVLTALHACDTATDEAILLGIRLKVKSMALVPCCQAEVASILSNDKTSAVSGDGVKRALHSLTEAPLHRREFGSHLTNVIRRLFLQSNGYRVTVTELTGWEHSLKNELIIAEYTGKAHEESIELLTLWREKIASLKQMKLLRTSS